MSAFKRFLVVLLVLVLTNAGTYLFSKWQCREQLEGQQALLAQAAQRTSAVEAELATAESELSRLRVWGDFIAIQQDLNRVSDEMNQLNFGNALDGVDAIIASLEAGTYGSTFREHKSRLLPILVEAKQALRNRSDAARRSLVQFNQAAFTVLSGLGPMQRTTGEGDTADTAPTPTPEIEAPPQPEPEAPAAKSPPAEQEPNEGSAEEGDEPS